MTEAVSSVCWQWQTTLTCGFATELFLKGGFDTSEGRHCSLTCVCTQTLSNFISRYACEAAVCQQPLTDALEESHKAMKRHLRAQVTVSLGTTEKTHIWKHNSLKTVIKSKLNQTTIHSQKGTRELRQSLPTVDANRQLLALVTWLKHMSKKYFCIRVLSIHPFAKASTSLF